MSVDPRTHLEEGPDGDRWTECEVMRYDLNLAQNREAWRKAITTSFVYHRIILSNNSGQWSNFEEAGFGWCQCREQLLMI